MEQKTYYKSKHYSEILQKEILGIIPIKPILFEIADFKLIESGDISIAVFIKKYNCVPYIFGIQATSLQVLAHSYRDSTKNDYYVLKTALSALKQMYPDIVCISNFLFEHNKSISNILLELKKGIIFTMEVLKKKELKEKTNNELEKKELCFNNFKILYDPALIEDVEKIIDIMLKNKAELAEKGNAKIGIITYEKDVFSESLKIKDLDISDKIEKIIEPNLHYKDGFSEFYRKFIERMKNSSKGIALFYGPPGTGKTYLIRNIIADLNKDKYFLYIPSNIINEILDPKFIAFLTDYILDNRDKKIVLIIEDAEILLQDREINYNYGISNLLNLTDGILNDILGFQVIATFNTDIEKLDKALLRNGRLIARKEFKKLTIDEVLALKKYLGTNGEVTKEMTLAEIYAQKNEEEILQHTTEPEIEKGKMGFL
ncbi:MAG: AAA family ATPase [FCB group bacterium]|jgi:DNA replication protein DnaC